MLFLIFYSFSFDIQNKFSLSLSPSMFSRIIVLHDLHLELWIYLLKNYYYNFPSRTTLHYRTINHNINLINYIMPSKTFSRPLTTFPTRATNPQLFQASVYHRISRVILFRFFRLFFLPIGQGCNLNLKERKI